MLTSIGKKSKSALAHQLDTKKKNKVLIDYCTLIKKNQLFTQKNQNLPWKINYKKKKK